MLAPHERRAGAQALLVWPGRVQPALEALPAPAQPWARRRTTAPRILGKRPPGPPARDDQPSSLRVRMTADDACEQAGGGAALQVEPPPPSTGPAASCIAPAKLDRLTNGFVGFATF